MDLDSQLGQLEALRDLRHFLEEELRGVQGVRLRQTLEPIGEPLGLQSPTPKLSEPVLSVAEASPGTVAAQVAEPDLLESLPLAVPARPLPPPFPKATPLRRICAALVDQILILLMLGFAMGTTLSIQGIVPWDLTPAHLAHLNSRLWLRLFALEYTAIWLAYLTLGIGILEMSFGMWVWGLRVRYGTREEDSRFLKKVARIVFTFLFQATWVPILLLVPIRGRTLLDVLSRSEVYKALE